LRRATIGHFTDITLFFLFFFFYLFGVYRQNSGLVTAALKGQLAVLDGIEWLSPGTLVALQRLVQDRYDFASFYYLFLIHLFEHPIVRREMTLPDGTVLLNHKKFDTVSTKTKQSPKVKKGPFILIIRISGSYQLYRFILGSQLQRHL
jgi:hypothetical protein